MCFLFDPSRDLVIKFAMCFLFDPSRDLDCPSMHYVGIESCSGERLESLSEYTDPPQHASQATHLSQPASLRDGKRWDWGGMRLMLAWKGRFAFAERLLDALLEGELSLKVGSSASSVHCLLHLSSFLCLFSCLISCFCEYLGRCK